MYTWRAALDRAWARSVTQLRPNEGVEVARQVLDAVGTTPLSERAECHKERHAVMDAARLVRVL